jgi:gas vesicle protein
MTNNHNHGFGTGLSYFTLGAAIGAFVTALCTPHSGRRMRRLLLRKAEDMQDVAVDTSRQIAERGRELYERGAKYAAHAAGR